MGENRYTSESRDGWGEVEIGTARSVGDQIFVKISFRPGPMYKAAAEEMARKAVVIKSGEDKALLFNPPRGGSVVRAEREEG